MRRLLATIICSVFGLGCIQTSNATVLVSAASTGVTTFSSFAAGALVSITATGNVDLANNDKYITDANGNITTGPTLGTGAYYYFLGENTSGVAPVAGVQKYDPTNPLASAPFGALLAGWSTGVTPTSWTLVGSSGSVVSPGSSYVLWFAVNDYGRGDNSGSFTVNYTTSPEPGTAWNCMSGLVGLIGIAYARKQSQRKQ